VSKPRKPSPRWHLSIGSSKIVLYKKQWEALLLLGPMWLLIKRAAIESHTRVALQKRGWVEFKPVAEHLMARLTKGGLAIRDSIHIREAERTNVSLWRSDGRRRRVPHDRKAPIPTT